MSLLRLGAPMLLAALCACAAPNPRHWSNPNASQQQFLADRSACINLAEFHRSYSKLAALDGPWYQENVFLACMDERGYKLDPKGKLVVGTD